MPNSDLEKKLVTIRAHLLQNSPIKSQDKRALQHAIGHLEEDLRAQPSLDIEVFEDYLLDWEATLAAEHPVLAGVVNDALQKLHAMGI